jgi:hypothetical protein
MKKDNPPSLKDQQAALLGLKDPPSISNPPSIPALVGIKIALDFRPR